MDRMEDRMCQAEVDKCSVIFFLPLNFYRLHFHRMYSQYSRPRIPRPSPGWKTGRFRQREACFLLFLSLPTLLVYIFTGFTVSTASLATLHHLPDRRQAVQSDITLL